MAYTVATAPGSSIQIVADQPAIRVGDCVAVEKVGETADIRRVAPEYCAPAHRPALAAVAAESRLDAGECAKAKQELVNATATAAADLVARKIGLLRNG
jgi:hypothetical protein